MESSNPNDAVLGVEFANSFNCCRAFSVVTDTNEHQISFAVTKKGLTRLVVVILLSAKYISPVHQPVISKSINIHHHRASLKCCSFVTNFEGLQGVSVSYLVRELFP